MNNRKLCLYIRSKLDRMKLYDSNTISIYLGNISNNQLNKLRIVFYDYNIERDYLGYYNFSINK